VSPCYLLLADNFPGNARLHIINRKLISPSSSNFRLPISFHPPNMPVLQDVVSWVRGREREQKEEPPTERFLYIRVIKEGDSSIMTRCLWPVEYNECLSVTKLGKSK
jgi:hypothetical protein